jgi:hypothetical protein
MTQLLNIVSHPSYTHKQSLRNQHVTVRQPSAPQPVHVSKHSIENQIRIVRYLGIVDRFFLALRCFSHQWSWPVTLRRPRHGDTDAPIQYPRGLNSHQVCMRCGVNRFYDSEKFHGGPLFHKQVL